MCFGDITFYFNEIQFGEILQFCRENYGWGLLFFLLENKLLLISINFTPKTTVA